VSDDPDDIVTMAKELACDPSNTLSALSPAAIIAAHKRAQALTELAQADAVLLDLPPTPAR